MREKGGAEGFAEVAGRRQVGHTQLASDLRPVQRVRTRLDVQRVDERLDEHEGAGRGGSLDLTVPDLAAEEEALVLGAKPLDAEDRGRGFRVYADPAGHPFCLCRD